MQFLFFNILNDSLNIKATKVSFTLATASYGLNRAKVNLNLIWFYTTFKSSTKYKQKIEFFKCPNCKESYKYETLKDGMCPTCDIKTIETEEYYKKYPHELEDV